MIAGHPHIPPLRSRSESRAVASARALSHIVETVEREDSPWYCPPLPPRTDGKPPWLSVLEYDARNVRGGNRKRHMQAIPFAPQGY